MITMTGAGQGDSCLLILLSGASSSVTPNKKCEAAGLKSLADYIAEHFDGNQRKFADAQGVKPPQVTQWLNAGFKVDGDTLYSERRVLKRAT